MRKIILFVFSVMTFFACHQKSNMNDLQNGDIIFQTSRSAQSKAIQVATNSSYSHMGIIYKQNDKLFVYEAVEPVKLTPLKEWIQRGKNGHFMVKRLKNAEKVLTPNVLAKMKKYGERHKGKHYDLYFQWTDERMYCSELVWKIYKHAAEIEIGKLEQLKDFDLTDPIVQKKLKERYGDNIPLNEPVITPAAMYSSSKLVNVTEQYLIFILSNY